MKIMHHGRSLTRQLFQPSATLEDLELDLRAAIATRRDLGDDKEDAIVASFLDRIERVIDVQVESRLREERARRRFITYPQLALVLAFAIPLTAVGGVTAGAAGIAGAWVAIFILIFLARVR